MISIIIPVTTSNKKYTDALLKNINELYPNRDEVEVIVEVNDDVTLGINYNNAVAKATGDKIILLHNDMLLSPNFIETMDKHIVKGRITTYTRVEPPIYPDTYPGKVLVECGRDLETFDQDKFNSLNYKNELSDGGSQLFFGCMKEDYIGIDGYTFKMFCEDDDLILRWKLLEMNLITSLDAITYHFVSKTSRFSEEYAARTSQIEHQSNRNFFRKWGNKQFKAKYDIGFVVENCDRNLISLVELFGEVYADNAVSEYIADEQKNTKFNLSERVKQYNAPKTNQILIYFDGTKFTNDHVGLLYQFPEIVANSGQIGTFELDIFKLDISGMDRLDHQLIYNNSQYYTNQLLKS